MSFYKTSTNKLHYLEDEAYESLLPADCIQITNEEAQYIIAQIEIQNET